MKNQMENKDISQIALQRIKESGVKPISKNIFNFRKVLFWSLVIISIVIGAISFSIILSMLWHNDWYLFNILGFGFIFKTLPYFWFVFLAIFTILGDFYYRKTYFGYRHRTVTIVGIYIFLTIITGSIFHIIGMSKIVEESVSENIPIYRVFIFDRDGLWLNHNEGFLSGEIININNNTISVVDNENNIWIVALNNAAIDTRVRLRIGEKIKIIGDINERNNFNAEQIHYWGR